MIPFIPPIRSDLFSTFMLLGFVQGLILAYFFLTHYKGKRLPNLFLGILILGMSLIISDVWLGYTNYMFQVLWIVDFTEPLNLLLAPMAYLYIRAGVSQRARKSDWLHLIPAVLYFVYMCVLVYPQGIAYKYNNHLGSYHPEMTYLPANFYGERWMFFPKRHINDFTFISMLIYNLAGFVFLRNAFKERGISFFTRIKNDLSWYRDIHLLLTLLVITFFVVRTNFSHDFGDHIVAASISLIIYITSFTVLRRSLFFQESNVRQQKKYEKSSLTSEIQSTTLRKLEEVMSSEKPFLDPGFSMPVLARRLGISPHHLSQILNEELKQNFFDFSGAYRIKEAQKLLTDGESNYIKIEEIAQMVGYNSKSAFNTAFRKVTGSTPSEYKKSVTK
jgi:AraC-like DNA-binding protein